MRCPHPAACTLGCAIAMQAACRGEGATADIGGRDSGEQHTQKMSGIVLTLVMFHIQTGWLKADATCRGSQAEGTRCGASCGPGGAGGGERLCGVRCARSVQRSIAEERARDCVQIGGQRTPNMPCMSVTLEVSQPEMSPLNLYAYCRESQAARTRCGAGCTGREAGGGERLQRARTACRGGRLRLCKIGGAGGGAAHYKHVVHVRDAGGVPVQLGLVEGVRALPRVASRAHGAGAGCGPGGREA